MKPEILGIVNITEDSFSDGGKYLKSDAALSHARTLLDDGATYVDLGAASSNPDAQAVPVDIEIARLEPLIGALPLDCISVDTFSPDVQRYVATRGVAVINDILGFPDPTVYESLATCKSKLIVMHSVQRQGPAQRLDIGPYEILERIFSFFDKRIPELKRVVSRDRLILDPGMGFFLSTNPESSFAVLRAIPRIQARYDLPILISVSRKSFLGAATNRPVSERTAATLACELAAIRLGADMIRTHNVASLVDGITIQSRLH
ncbi:MAG: dihydropteroate synthase [Leptospirales bacterium]|nr:dihydropteroate synthase [Leptospirales bacterium]